MEGQDKAVDVIIYRVRDNGLEVFLVNAEAQNTLAREASWKAPSSEGASPDQLLLQRNCIELESAPGADGEARKAIAIEADWHEIPSLRALMYEDYRVAKAKAKQHIKNIFPEMEKGAFFAVKEALKRVMPEQYAYLKELKDILVEKNQTRSI